MAGDTQRGSDRRRGATVIEAALCLLLFVTIAIGMVDCGRVLFMRAAIADRLRTALRYGVLHADDTAGIQNMVMWGKAAEQVTPPSFGLTRESINVLRSGAGTADDRITITVSGHQIELITPGIAGIITARPVSAAMPVETL